MDAIRFIFFLFALICFIIATFVPTIGRVTLLAAGLALFTVPFLLDAAGVST